MQRGNTKNIISLLEIFRRGLITSNLLSALGIGGKSCEPFIDMCKELEFDQQHADFIVRKLSAIIIRSTIYMFCMRNNPWTNPYLQYY